MDICEKSRITNENNLKRINKLIDIDSNLDDILFKIKDNDIPYSTQNSYLTALSWYYKKNDKSETEIKKIGREISDVIKKIQKQYNENMLSDREIKLYTTWNVIKKIHNILSNKIDNNYIYADYVLLSLYVLHPPRRRDYSELFYSNIDIPNDSKSIIWNNTDSLKTHTEEPYKKNTNISLTDKNYYVRNKDISYFVFDNYKTSHIYGRQIIEVNNELKKIIDDFIDKQNIKHGTKILEMKDYNITDRLANIFYKYIGKKISISMLRHIYISYALDSLKMNENEKTLLSMKMAHSKGTQSIYKKIVKDSIEKNIEAEDMKKLNLIETGKKIVNNKNKYNNDEDRKKAILETKRKYYYQKKLKLQQLNNN